MCCGRCPTRAELTKELFHSIRSSISLLTNQLYSRQVAPFVSVCFSVKGHSLLSCFHGVCEKQVLQQCLSVLNPPTGTELAPYAFLLCVVQHTPLATQFQSFYARCGYKSNNEALCHYALSSPTLFLGGASVVCEKMTGIKMNTWKEFAVFSLLSQHSTDVIHETWS